MGTLVTEDINESVMNKKNYVIRVFVKELYNDERPNIISNGIKLKKDFNTYGHWHKPSN